jgi:pentose-5-phosphate-3-epimerase
MTEIIPAILAHTEEELRAKLATVPRGPEWVHVDFCELLSAAKSHFEKSSENSGSLMMRPLAPDISKMCFAAGYLGEAHLMIPNPVSFIDDCVRVGFSRVVVQVEHISAEAFAALIHEWRHAIEVVPSLEIETPLKVIDSYAHELQSVQLMGIAEIGAQGRTFDSRVIERVRVLHTRYPKLIISVDGGVNRESALALEEVGARRLVVGSAIGEFYG